MLKFTIPLNPVTKKNSQQIIQLTNKKTNRVRHSIIQSKKYLQYERDCAWFIKNIKAPTGRINICAHFYREKKYRVDLPNLIAALHDILVKYEVIEDDNADIAVSVDGSRVFYDSLRPRTEVVITLAI